MGALNSCEHADHVIPSLLGVQTIGRKKVTKLALLGSVYISLISRTLLESLVPMLANLSVIHSEVTQIARNAMQTNSRVETMPK